MKKISVGILAHVDAGKTTLSEGMLYESGMIRKLGRVDTKDAFLDTYELEKKRGITIFSKQAVIKTDEMVITLLDTPGHVDFSAEMERTLQVMDYAILVISASEGIQAHTETLWKLLYDYDIPVFVFVNKMDQSEQSRESLITLFNDKLGDGFVDFSEKTASYFENIAMLDETALEDYLDSGTLSEEKISELISERRLFPCFFGSALKMNGIREFLAGLERFTVCPKYPETFGARIYKIARDEQGNRLTFLKITGGKRKVKDILTGEEKINQIRIYSGAKYETMQEIYAGDIAAVTGPVSTYAGQGLGFEDNMEVPLLQPVLTYRVLLQSEIRPEEFLPMLKSLEEEEPLLHVLWNENLSEIQIEIMGEVQLQVLRSLVQERFKVAISFDEGTILFKETIAAPSYGVGHFEPLRHYAEVHLLMEPLPSGSGLVFDTKCSEDILDINWQRLILTHLAEKQHVGVLTGSPITDMRITLVSGKAHNKHTEGGDFRQAVYRGVRQGLMAAESVLLEPYYEFSLTVPQDLLGRAMTDLDRMKGRFRISQNDEGTAELTGIASVRALQNYQSEVTAYTKGLGRLQCTYAGYFKCCNQQEIAADIRYDCNSDAENPSGSVFCRHGAGFYVAWNEVYRYMHMPFAVSGFSGEKDDTGGADCDALKQNSQYEDEALIGTDEIDAILERAVSANKRKRPLRKRRYKEKVEPSVSNNKGKIKKFSVDYLLVDGYNIIHAWDELNELLPDNMDGARGRLLDMLCNYQAVKGCELIVVFDAYRLKGHDTEITDYHNIHVVFTREAETADQYIEKFAHSNGEKYNITVATSDGMEQLIIRGAGCMLLSAREFWREVETVCHQNREDYEKKNKEALSGINHNSMEQLLDEIWKKSE